MEISTVRSAEQRRLLYVALTGQIPSHPVRVSRGTMVERDMLSLSSTSDGASGVPSSMRLPRQGRGSVQRFCDEPPRTMGQVPSRPMHVPIERVRLLMYRKGDRLTASASEASSAFAPS